MNALLFSSVPRTKTTYIPLTYPTKNGKCIYRVHILQRALDMTTTTVFKSNRTQAVRLPKDVAFPENIKKVDIVIVGNARVITPSEFLWDDWFNAEGVSDDFMNERAQPESQTREAF